MEKNSYEVRAESFYNLQFISHPQLSKDGTLATFVVTEVKEERKGYRSSIYLWRKGEAVRPFTSGRELDASPVFSPRGDLLAFTSTRNGGKAQLYLIRTDGGEAEQLTNLKSGVSSPRFSRDGKYIAFLSRGEWENISEKEGMPQAASGLFYKWNALPGSGLFPESPLNLWLYDCESKKVRQWTSHPVDIESFDLGNDDTAVFIAPHSVESRGTKGVVAFLITKDSSVPTALTDECGLMTGISLSPDGDRAAVLADPDFFTEPGDPHLYTFTVNSGTTLERVAPWYDQFFGESLVADSRFGAYPCGPYWVDDESLITLCQVRGRAVVTKVELNGEIQVLSATNLTTVSALSASSNGDVLFVSERFNLPATVSLLTQNNIHTSAEPLFDSRGRLPSAHKLTREHLCLATDEGELEGWVIKPENWEEGKKYPVVFQIHGGPAMAWGDSYLHEFLLLAQQGYAVAFCNVRGSTGYGNAYTASIQGKYFTKDFDDFMSFCEAVTKRFSWIDEQRMGLIGGSYGGALVNWIISHSNKFHVAITDRSICNWVSMYGSSDIGYRFVPRELRGKVPYDTELLWERSPLKYVSAVKTPCLILHSENDRRCPMEQAEQWYVGLKQHNVPVRFVRIPGESHELSRSGRPDRRVARLKEYLEWCGKYL